MTITRTRASTMLAAAAIFLACLPAQGQYLRRLGPAALVWKAAPVPRLDKIMTLPPLVFLEPDPVPTTNEPSAVLPAPLEPALPEPGAIVDPSGIPYLSDNTAPDGNFVEAASGSSDEPAPPAFPLQSLAPFFSSTFGTNRAVEINVPLSFNPPDAPPQRSSTATYTTSKP